MNQLAKLNQVMKKHPGHTGHTARFALSREYGYASGGCPQWFYCGPPNKKLELDKSPLANSGSKGDEAIERYRGWLWSQIKGNNLSVLRALFNIKIDTTLVCLCAPAPSRCHCKVISRAAAWLRNLPTEERHRNLCLAAGFKVTDADTTMINGQVIQRPEWRATYSVGREFVTIVHRAFTERWKWTVETESLCFGPEEEELSEWLNIVLRRIEYGKDDWFKYRLTDFPNKGAKVRRKRALKLGFLFSQ